MLDYLNVNPDDASQSNQERGKGKAKKEKDARMFSPNINNPEKEYQARVRQLPQGLNGLKNKLPVSVEQHTHFIKEPQHKLYLTVKCRKTLGENEYCPICDATWKMFNAGKDAGDKALMDKAKSRLAKVSHIGNFLVRDDINNPENNGQVKLWRHTGRMHKQLLEPTRSEDDGQEKRGFKKAKERFTPYSPIDGKDFYVIVTENPENQFPTYDGSYWDEEGLSNLAKTEDEMMGILEKCHDLSEFINDVESVEELQRKYTEFNNKLEERMSANGGTFSGGQGGPSSNTATNEVKGTTTSNEDYFGGSTVSEPVSEDPFNESVNSETPDEPMLGGGDDEDELPF